LCRHLLHQNLVLLVIIQHPSEFLYIEAEFILDCFSKSS
jgi:hypothetical protein